VGVVKNLCPILLDHFRRYPEMQVTDLYKLLHQAALGSEHAVRDERTARDWLEREMKEMGEGPDEPLLDPISPDGKIVRIHLRPYLKMGKDPETLLRAFIHTANEWHGSLENLMEYGTVAWQLSEAEQWRISPKEIKLFFAGIESQGFPAARHSEIYGRLYRPAYRVIANFSWRPHESIYLPS